MKNTGASLGLTALLTLFCLVSCITTDPSLGSALVPSSQDITIQTTTLDLPLEDVRTIDDLQSRILSSATVGSFGMELSSEGLMSVSAATDSVAWGRDPSVRRIYLSLVRDTTLVLQDNQRYIPQNLYVHRLNFELDTTHRNALSERFKTAYYDAEPINVGGCIYTGADAWSVDLKKEIGEELLRIPMETRDSAALFMKQFYGFCLRTDAPDDAQASREGEGRLNVFNLSSSYLILSWDYTDEDGFRKSSTAYFQLGQHHALNLYRSLKPETGTDDAILVQGLTGAKPHVSGLQLKQAIEAWAEREDILMENLALAKATVEFPFEYNGDRNQFDNYAAFLYPCQRTLVDGIPFYAPISEINNTTLENGSLDRSLLYYKSNISLYLQRLLRKDADKVTEEDDLWFMPTFSRHNSNTDVTYYYADNRYYSLTRLNGTGALRHPVLRLTYTVLK